MRAPAHNSIHPNACACSQLLTPKCLLKIAYTQMPARAQIQEIVASFSAHGRMRYPYVGVTLAEVGRAALHHVQAHLPQLLGEAAVAVMVQVCVSCVGRSARMRVCLCACVRASTSAAATEGERPGFGAGVVCVCAYECLCVSTHAYAVCASPFHVFLLNCVRWCVQWHSVGWPRKQSSCSTCAL